MKLLITGGTAFVSKYTAAYFYRKGYHVTVLNRNTKPQVPGVDVIAADRHDCVEACRGQQFDAVLDICAYDDSDIRDIWNALPPIKTYIMISSSAVYPETNPQPFTETQKVGENSIWGAYGTNKIKAERALLERHPDAYILRPPYLYGPMQNVYREPFVFDCALQHRPFYIPKDGKMKLQFFHVEDLCKVMEAILHNHPQDHILNVGNEQSVDINTFVKLCYQAAKEPLRTVYVDEQVEQRRYFSFHDYAYELDVSKMKALLPETIPLEQGLEESYAWYQTHREEIVRKPYLSFIDQEL